MKNIIILWITILLAGCASVDPHLKTSSTNVKWVLKDDINTWCRNLTDGSFLITYHGCARWKKDFSSCIIYTSKKTNNFVLGHELRHCFEGHFHQ